jgi:hypothetical protein
MQTLAKAVHAFMRPIGLCHWWQGMPSKAPLQHLACAMDWRDAPLVLNRLVQEYDPFQQAQTCDIETARYRICAYNDLDIDSSQFPFTGT